MAFNFPDPTVEQVAKNPETGISYKYMDPPGKWVIESLADSAIREVDFEGDSPPDPRGDYKLWYSTNALELYYYYCDPNDVCAWLPTSTPIQILEGLNSAVAAQSVTIQHQLSRIQALEQAVFSNA